MSFTISVFSYLHTDIWPNSRILVLQMISIVYKASSQQDLFTHGIEESDAPYPWQFGSSERNGDVGEGWHGTSAPPLSTGLEQHLLSFGIYVVEFILIAHSLIPCVLPQIMCSIIILQLIYFALLNYNLFYQRPFES